MHRENAAKICLLYKEKGRFTKNLREEMELLRTNGYAITLVDYSLRNAARRNTQGRGETYRLSDFVNLIRESDFDFYHSNELFGMILGVIVSAVVKGRYIKDYQELLLPPIRTEPEGRTECPPAEAQRGMSSLQEYLTTLRSAFCQGYPATSYGGQLIFIKARANRVFNLASIMEISTSER
ncbi:MAG: hypothetical protein ACYTEQ_23055 [Planctomycetota bacterium]|jgi:hypothetical protein